MTKKEKIAQMNSHQWNWTGLSEQAFGDDTGTYFHCQYCGAELEYHYEMENELGEKIWVGSECMKKIGWIATGDKKKKFNQAKKQMKNKAEMRKLEIESGLKIGSKIYGEGMEESTGKYVQINTEYGLISRPIRKNGYTIKSIELKNMSLTHKEPILKLVINDGAYSVEFIHKMVKENKWTIN